MASKIFKDMFDYLKWDDNYWTKERKKEFTKRIAFFMLVPAIVILGHSIVKKQYPWKVSYNLGYAFQTGIEELSKDFPFKTQAYFNLLMSKRQKLSLEELSELLDNPYTERNIKRLISKDKKIKYSEVGGAAIIKEGKNGKYLKFEDAETEDMKFSKKLTRKLNNKEYLKKLFSSSESEEMFDKMGVKERHQEITKTIKNEEINEKIIKLLTKDYLQRSDRVYQQTNDELMELFYPRSNGEKTIGMFHIHLRGEGPSKIDYEKSKQYGREIVIACRGGGYTLYEVMNGKINNKILMDYKY